jgi:hypothetical protein
MAVSQIQAEHLQRAPYLEVVKVCVIVEENRSPPPTGRRARLLWQISTLRGRTFVIVPAQLAMLAVMSVAIDSPLPLDT